MFQRLVVLTILAATLAGCGEPVKPVTLLDLQGKVDATLPPDAQAKQEALRRLLNGLQEGIGDTTALRLFVPGINYRESFTTFFEGKRLARWEFSGQPQGNQIAVVLYFDDKNGGPIDPQQERRVERTYIVTGSGSNYVISRK